MVLMEEEDRVDRMEEEVINKRQQRRNLKTPSLDSSNNKRRELNL